MDNKALDILKSAILLEKRGYEFYKNVAEQTPNPTVKEFFMHMANEETEHCEVLAAQFKSFKETGEFQQDKLPSEDSNSVDTKVLTKKLKDEISSASYEAAAIAAAMSMEKAAIALYRDRMNSTNDPDEKALYKWLVEFEDGHLDDLAAIDKELQEKIWYDNGFWPS